MDSFYGSYIWSDGENIYRINSSSSYILNLATSTWETKTWSGDLTYFDGRQMWTDGENIYASQDSTQCILKKGSSSWLNHTWSGLTEIRGSYIWTDGDRIYYSRAGTSEQYVLNW